MMPVALLSRGRRSPRKEHLMIFVVHCSYMDVQKRQIFHFENSRLANITVDLIFFFLRLPPITPLNTNEIDLLDKFVVEHFLPSVEMDTLLTDLRNGCR